MGPRVARGLGVARRQAGRDGRRQRRALAAAVLSAQQRELQPIYMSCVCFYTSEVLQTEC